ncbi:Arm DNA-binding domain-containing protein [Geobacter argillaceus]|uniref:Arm DNA-binding domain-containing protein n=1 Tax=Geobacter argillaceus TaxID=345631 RepID=UPI0038B3AC15
MPGKDCKPKNKQFYIREGNGFAIRSLPSGVKTFVYVYTLAGQRRQMNFGSYPEVSLTSSSVRKKLH